MFDLPFLFGGNSFAPDFSAADPGAAIPQPLPEQVAQHLAMQGIKPAEFMANPKAFEQGAAGMKFPPSNDYNAQPPFVYPDRSPVQPRPVQTLSYQAPPGGESADVLDTGGRSTAPTSLQPPQPTTEQMSAKGKGGDTVKNLTDTLKGVQALQPPQPQRVYTPSPVNPGHATAGAVKGAQLAALLQMIAGKQGTPQMPLPLGAVLAGRT